MDIVTIHLLCFCPAGAKITKLDGEHSHISSMLATKGLLWLGTSLGIILVYRIPCLEGVPLISGRPYLAYDSHHDSVRVLLPMTVTSRPVKQRIGSCVLREHVRKMNRPISSLVLIDDDHRSISPISDLSTSGNVTNSQNDGSDNNTNKKDGVFSEDLSKAAKERIAQEVIKDLTSHDKVEGKSDQHKRKNEYETLSWFGPGPDPSLRAQDLLIELTASQEQCYDVPPAEDVDGRRGSGDYEVVEYPEDGCAVDVPSNLYTPMHPRNYSMSIPGKDSAPPDKETQLVVTAGRGLTHFRKLRSRTLYKTKPVTTATSKKNSTQDGYLIVYELDSTLRMFNPEEEDTD